MSSHTKSRSAAASRSATFDDTQASLEDSQPASLVPYQEMEEEEFDSDSDNADNNNRSDGDDNNGGSEQQEEETQQSQASAPSTEPEDEPESTASASQHSKKRGAPKTVKKATAKAPRSGAIKGKAAGVVSGSGKKGKAVAAEASAEASSKDQQIKKKKNKRRNKHVLARDLSNENYAILKQVHPELGISKKGMKVIVDLANYVSNKIFGGTLEVTDFCHKNGDTQRGNISLRHLMFGIQLALPDDLALHAISEGTKSLRRYQASLEADEVKG